MFAGEKVSTECLQEGAWNQKTEIHVERLKSRDRGVAIDDREGGFEEKGSYVWAREASRVMFGREEII